MLNIIRIDTLNNDTLFHFTKKKNLRYIMKDGLTTSNHERENETKHDKDMPAIYFSKGFDGLLKTMDVFIRWKYDQLAEKLGVSTGGVYVDNELMIKVFEKIYEEEKNRIYFSLNLIEGEDPLTSDYSSKKMDFKKNIAKQKGYINSPRMIWEWGKYSNLDSEAVEDWNMYTHLGDKVISPNNINLICTENGELDALSILFEARKMYSGDFELENLDSFLEYVKTNKMQKGGERHK